MPKPCAALRVRALAPGAAEISGIEIMEKPNHHLFVCASFRVSGTPQGICHKKGSINLLGYLENEILSRGLDGVVVSSTGCLKACEHGPVVAVYPENQWYGKVEDEAAIDAILDALEDGSVAEDYALA
jgi:(2Fe-2S) ferredoxin